MYSGKKKISDVASTAKEKVDIYKAKVEEKAEKAVARTKEEREIAEEKRKAKEAEAKMELHEAKAEHAAEKLHEKHSGHHLYGHQPHTHQTLGTVDPTTGTAAPAYPLGGHPPGHHTKYK